MLQIATNQQTRSIQKTAEQAGVTTLGQKVQLAELASQENVEGQRATAIKEKLEQVAVSLATNKLDNTDVGKIAKEAVEGMKEVGQKDMPAAANELSKAQNAAGQTAPKPETPRPEGAKDPEKQSAKDTAEAAGKAGENQEQAIRTMESLIEKLASQNEFSDIRQRVTAAIKAQQRAEKTLRDIAKDTFGKKPEELTKEEKEKLEQARQGRGEPGQGNRRSDKGRRGCG